MKRAPAPGALGGDGSSVGFDDLAADVEPESEAAEVARRRGPRVSVEDSGLLAGIESDAVIFDHEPHAALAFAHGDLDRVPPPNLMALDTRFDTTWASREASQWPRTGEGASNEIGDFACFKLVLEARKHLTRDLDQVHIRALEPQLAGVHARDVEQIADLVREPAALTLHEVQRSRNTARSLRPCLQRSRIACVASSNDVTGVRSSCDAIERNSSRWRTASRASCSGSRCRWPSRRGARALPPARARKARTVAAAARRASARRPLDRAFAAARSLRCRCRLADQPLVFGIDAVLAQELVRHFRE